MINTQKLVPIAVEPIGIIHTPYPEPKDIPIQGILKSDVEGWVELEEKYQPGLKDLDGFSHAILIYYFHRSNKEHLEGSDSYKIEGERSGCSGKANLFCILPVNCSSQRKNFV